MADENHNPANQRAPHEPGLDAALDAALAKYTAVEPRAGLEERILAHLQLANQPAERSHAIARAWWRSGWAVAMAVVIVIFAVTLALRSSRPSQPSVKNTPSISIPNPPKTEKKNEEPQLANRNRNAAPPRHASLPHGVSHEPEAVADAHPRLDQFPSPRPLSEQEKLLLEYVQENPEEAAMIAQAQTAFARQEERERSAPQPGDANPQVREQLE